MIRFPPRKILVPMDLSDSSMAAWKQAVELARDSNSKLEVLYVQPWVHAALGLGFGDPMATAQASEMAMAELKRRVEKHAQVHSITGEADVEIVSWAKRRNFDLIVMGTHGRTGMDRMILGSVAESVVRRTEVPVLVARRASLRVSSVLVPIHAEPYSWEALVDAGRIAAGLGAKLTVQHVFDSPIFGGEMGFEGTRQLLQAMISKLPSWILNAARPQVHLSFGNPAEEIVEEGTKHDLVVMVARRKGFLKDKILGSTAERVLRHLPTDLIALPERAPKPAEIAKIFRFPIGGRTHESSSRTRADKAERLAGLHHEEVHGRGWAGSSRRGRRAPGRDLESHDLPESDRRRSGVRRSHGATPARRKGRTRNLRSARR